MARVPDDELERLKQDIDLADLARELGVKLRIQGKNLVGLCPFHEDHDPSLVITPRKNLWSCLGACQTGGSVIDWVMKLHRCGFREAVDILRRRNGQPITNEATSTSRSKPPLTLGASDEQMMHEVLDYYHTTLKQHLPAQEYLKQRGISGGEAISQFRLGFSDRSLGKQLPLKQTIAGRALRSQLLKLGILRRTGHEAFWGSLVIPIFDEQGRVTEIYGRKVTRALRKGTPLHLYLPGPHRGVWNLAAFRNSREIILCESLIDALTFWCAGFRNVTASYGTNGFTQDHLEAMKAYGTERVLIAYDRDDAGNAAAKKLAGELGEHGISSFRVLFPRGMDANEYALKVTPAERSLAVLLRGAEHLAGPVMTRVVVNEPEKPLTERSEAGKSHGKLDSQKEEQSFSSLAATPSSSDEPPPAPASPVPPAPRLEIPAEVDEHEVVIRFDERRWRVRGLSRNMSFEQLRVNLLVAREGEEPAFHVDTLDLYSARHRASYIKLAASELGLKPELVKGELGKVLLKLEELQEQQISEALEPADKAVPLSDAERREAMALLQDPKLLERIAEDFESCGVIGEQTNKLVGYLAATSRKLDEPLAVLIQSSSAAGKSALMNAVLAFMPEEERVQYSAMTGQSLFYMGETNLKHKILAIAEEEGAERASYALKLLQSEGELTIASTGKDPSSGRLVTHEYRVEGPVAILLTTTAIDIDEELLNRCIVLSVDEERSQTQAIHRLQRERRTLEGIKTRRRRDATLKLHRNAQRLLEPLAVVNPYAHHLTFLDTQTRTRRDHEKYLTLIDTVALLHQHQRKIHSYQQGGETVSYIEVALEDIEIANQLAAEALGRTLAELPPQTARLLMLIDGLVTEACERQGTDRSSLRFTRRDIREHTGWGYTQLTVHLQRLEEMEYLLIHQGRRGQRIFYELLYESQGKEGEAFVLKLLDIEKLRAGYDTNLSGSESNLSASDSELSGSGSNLSGPNRPQIGALSGGCQVGEKPTGEGVSGKNPELEPKNAHLELEKTRVSYKPRRRTHSGSSSPVAMVAKPAGGGE